MRCDEPGTSRLSGHPVSRECDLCLPLEPGTPVEMAGRALPGAAAGMRRRQAYGARGGLPALPFLPTPIISLVKKNAYFGEKGLDTISPIW